jgi:hypothetical protein
MSGFAGDADSRRMLVEAVDGPQPPPTADGRYALVSRRPDVARMRRKADAFGPNGGARLLGRCSFLLAQSYLSARRALSVDQH